MCKLIKLLGLLITLLQFEHRSKTSINTCKGRVVYKGITKDNTLNKLKSKPIVKVLLNTTIGLWDIIATKLSTRRHVTYVTQSLIMRGKVLRTTDYSSNRFNAGSFYPLSPNTAVYRNCNHLHTYKLLCGSCTQRRGPCQRPE